MQAQPSGRMSDSDVYAITHAESAAQASPPGGYQDLIQEHGPTSKGADTGAQQYLTGRDKPALLQLQDLASADAMTPQHKPLGSMSRAAADSPPGAAYPSTGKSSADAQAQRPPALAQLRALAGVADSPQTLHQIGKSADELSNLASAPLSQWQFGNSGTAHAVWQAGRTSRGHAATGPSEPVSTQSDFSGAESAGGRAASPRWGPSEPPQPVHLEIKVLSKEGSSDRPSASRAGPRADSPHDSLREPTVLEEKYAGGSSFGVEAGYGNHAGVTLASCQSHSTAAGTAAAAGMAGKPSHSATAGALAVGSGTSQDAGSVATALAKADASSASRPAQAKAAGLASAAGSAAAVGHQGFHPGAHVGQNAHPVGSAGAAELAEAAGQLEGSPWDPRQGPKLLESLSDFSSFNSSLSMLQQLAGKSAAGLATLGIGSTSSSSSSSHRALEKKKSDKGHLISSAPTAWWRRRPGSAKKNAAPQVKPRVLLVCQPASEFVQGDCVATVDCTMYDRAVYGISRWMKF